MIDDELETGVHHTFNETLATIGYQVLLTASNGSTITLNSSFISLNNNIILAGRVDGDPLSDSEWPVRLVGVDISNSQMISQITQIEMIF